MKKYIFIGMFASMAFSAFAQTITVKDKLSLTNLQGVVLRVDGNEVISTDVDGKANINTNNLTFKVFDYKTLPLQHSSTWVKSSFQPPEHS